MSGASAKSEEAEKWQNLAFSGRSGSVAPRGNWRQPIISHGSISFGSVFVEMNELTEGDWKDCIFGGAKRIYTKLYFQFCHDHGKAKRIEAGIQQSQMIGERRQWHSLFICNLFELIYDFGTDIHNSLIFSLSR
jgi:hypothetical protein